VERAEAGGRDAASRATTAFRSIREHAQSTFDAVTGRFGELTRGRQQERRNRIRRRIGTAAGAGAAGAAGAWFLDPRQGKRRRHVARDRIAALLRRTAQVTRRQASYRGGQVAGLAKRARSEAEPEEPAANDQALADRVKSEIFRPAESPKESVSVNVENGVVFLRGEVKRPEQIEELVETTRSVEGVQAVESLLHTPKTAAPMKEDGKASRVGKQAS
jgi:hypothetical protein